MSWITVDFRDPVRMNDSRTQVLYIENDEGLAQLLRRRLKRYGYELEWVADGHSGLERLQKTHYDVIAIDYELPDMNGLTVLERMQELDQTPPAIMISNAGKMDTVIAAMKVGAADYIVKTVDGSYMDLLPPTIERVLEKERLKLGAEAAKRALEEKTELLSLTLRSISQGLAVFDSNLCLVTWNDSWLDLFDYPLDLVQEGTPHQAFADFCNNRDRNNSEDALAHFMREVRDGREQTAEYERYDGAVIHIKANPMPDGGIVNTYTDITERKKAEEEQRLAAAVFQTSGEPMLITDSHARIKRCNRAFEDTLGYSRDELLGYELSTLASGEYEADFFDELWQLLKRNGHWRDIIWTRHKNGQLSPHQVMISAVNDTSGQVSEYVAVYTDMSAQMRREQEMRHQAQHDVLTGLPNRHLLADRISHAIEVAKRETKGFALLFLDLDGFKPINDNYGHGTGDLLLIEIAHRLTYRCRGSDTVARYGGDEFVVLLRNADGAEAVDVVAKELIEAVAQPVSIDGVDLEVRASIGVAFYPHHAESATALLSAADQAMYSAKDAGKDCYRIYTDSGESPGPDFS